MAGLWGKASSSRPAHAHVARGYRRSVTTSCGATNHTLCRLLTGSPRYPGAGDHFRSASGRSFVPRALPIALFQFIPTANIHLDLFVLIARVSDLAHAPLPIYLEEVPSPPRPSKPKPKPGAGSTTSSSTRVNRRSRQVRSCRRCCKKRAKGAYLPLQFWTTAETRDRLVRIVSKICRPDEKRRLMQTRRSGSRVAAGFVPVRAPGARLPRGTRAFGVGRRGGAVLPFDGAHVSGDPGPGDSRVRVRVRATSACGVAITGTGATSTASATRKRALDGAHGAAAVGRTARTTLTANMTSEGAAPQDQGCAGGGPPGGG